MTAAQTIAALVADRSLTLDDIPEDVVERREAPPARHARLRPRRARARHRHRGPRRRWRELGGEPQATVIGLDGALPAPNAAFANAMLCHGLDFDDTHSDSVSHVSAVVAPAALAAARGAGRDGRELLAAIVAGNEVVTRGSAWRRRARSTRAASTRRRSAGSSAATAAVGAAHRRRRRDGRERARHRRLVRRRALRLPRRRDRDEADAPRLGGARRACSRRGSPRSAREGRPDGARGPLRPLPRVRRRGAGEIDIDGAARRPRRALGDAADRVQAVSRPATSSTARSAPRRPRSATSTRTRSRTSSSRSPRPASRSCSSRPSRRSRRARSTRAKFSLQYSTAAMLVHGRVGVARLHRRGDRRPARARPGAAKVRYETKEYPTYPAAFPGGVRITLRGRPDVSRPTSRTSGAGRRTRCRADEVRAKFRENAALALGASAVEALEAAILGARGARRRHGGCSRRSRCESRRCARPSGRSR